MELNLIIIFLFIYMYYQRLKRDKYVLPQLNQDYKNGYKYNLNYFNHNKYKEV